ncbi:hypothetical protein B4U80_05306, partial [Leptotrombidium deliense]
MPNVLSKLWNKILMPEWSFPYNCYEVGHTWDPSCTKSVWLITSQVLREGFLMYSGLYLFSLLALSRKINAEKVKETIESILTSTAFLGFNGFAMFAFFCATRKLSGTFYYTLVSALPAFLGSLLAIQIERPSRRGALAVYCANIASECLYRMSEKKGYIRSLPNGET